MRAVLFCVLLACGVAGAVETNCPPFDIEAHGRVSYNATIQAWGTTVEMDVLNITTGVDSTCTRNVKAKVHNSGPGGPLEEQVVFIPGPQQGACIKSYNSPTSGLYEVIDSSSIKVSAEGWWYWLPNNEWQVKDTATLTYLLPSPTLEIAWVYNQTVCVELLITGFESEAVVGATLKSRAQYEISPIYIGHSFLLFSYVKRDGEAKELLDYKTLSPGDWGSVTSRADVDCGEGVQFSYDLWQLAPGGSWAKIGSSDEFYGLDCSQ